MAGRMVMGAGPANDVGTHEHVTIQTDDGRSVRYIDARRFGFMDLFPRAGLDVHPRLAGLGLEPVGAAGATPLTGPVLATLFAGKAAPLKAALLDRSEEHTSELQSLMRISYAVFCLKKNNKTTQRTNT